MRIFWIAAISFSWQFSDAFYYMPKFLCIPPYVAINGSCLIPTPAEPTILPCLKNLQNSTVFPKNREVVTFSPPNLIPEDGATIGESPSKDKKPYIPINVPVKPISENSPINQIPQEAGAGVEGDKTNEDLSPAVPDANKVPTESSENTLDTESNDNNIGKPEDSNQNESNPDIIAPSKQKNSTLISTSPGQERNESNHPEIGSNTDSKLKPPISKDSQIKNIPPEEGSFEADNTNKDLSPTVPEESKVPTESSENNLDSESNDNYVGKPEDSDQNESNPDIVTPSQHENSSLISTNHGQETNESNLPENGSNTDSKIKPPTPENSQINQTSPEAGAVAGDNTNQDLSTTVPDANKMPTESSENILDSEFNDNFIGKPEDSNQNESNPDIITPSQLENSTQILTNPGQETNGNTDPVNGSNASSILKPPISENSQINQIPSESGAVEGDKTNKDLNLDVPYVNKLSSKNTINSQSNNTNISKPEDLDQNENNPNIIIPNKPANSSVTLTNPGQETNGIRDPVNGSSASSIQNVSKPRKLDGKNFESNLAVGNDIKPGNIAEDPNQNPKKENTIVSTISENPTMNKTGDLIPENMESQTKLSSVSLAKIPSTRPTISQPPKKGISILPAKMPPRIYYDLNPPKSEIPSISGADAGVLPISPSIPDTDKISSGILPSEIPIQTALPGDLNPSKDPSMPEMVPVRDPSIPDTENLIKNTLPSEGLSKIVSPGDLHTPIIPDTNEVINGLLPSERPNQVPSSGNTGHPNTHQITGVVSATKPVVPALPGTHNLVPVPKQPILPKIPEADHSINEEDLNAKPQSPKIHIPGAPKIINPKIHIPESKEPIIPKIPETDHLINEEDLIGKPQSLKIHIPGAPKIIDPKIHIPESKEPILPKISETDHLINVKDLIAKPQSPKIHIPETPKIIEPKIQIPEDPKMPKLIRPEDLYPKDINIYDLLPKDMFA
ncbi:proteoglycan 4 isoform X1 [Drosophila mauritiana]|uniref:Proteoglycan 4 isoform X1 n=1 Tax=Drosophila mauritiana TaxID=7226 RepID=A0A6P8JIZ8_DROMA|nr:proteoglycan 4 isoform X1 [Drosophila mauritiana]